MSPASENTTPATTVTGRRYRLWSHVRSNLTWGRLYRATSYLKSALWTVPLIAIALELVVAPTIHVLDAWLEWRPRELQPAGATAMYQTVITMTLSFLVFTFGSLLVAIQVAGGQLTPRIIATILLRDNVVRYSVGLFCFTLVFAVGALNRQDASVYEFVALVAALLGIACIADFLFLIDYAARLLRPVSVVAKVGKTGVAMIDAVYPEPAMALTPEAAALHMQPRVPSRGVEHHGASGIILAVDIPTLVVLAERHNGLIEFVPQVGDFLAVQEPLFVLHGGAMAIPNRVVRSTVAIGPERTLEQDPMFAFRIIVDIGAQGVVAGDQRSDDGRARARPDSSAAADGRAAEAARRGHPRRRRAAAPHLPHPELGGLRTGRLQRDSLVRRQQSPDRAAHARDARKPAEHAAGTPAPGAGIGTRHAGLGDSGTLQPARGARAGQDSRPAGAGRIVGNALNKRRLTAVQLVAASGTSGARRLPPRAVA